MQSVIQMTDYFKENSPKTTRPLVALYCGSRAGNKPVYLEKAIQKGKQAGVSYEEIKEMLELLMEE